MAKTGRFSDWILHEDDDLLVINKPAGLASLHERSAERGSVLQQAREYWPDAQLCHRLDKETSGALVIAKNPEAYRHMAMRFEQREVVKTYHAVVEGQVMFEEFEVDLPIWAMGKDKVSIDYARGKDAMTIFNTLEMFGHYTLMECLPVTGRMHQIRIHLASQNARIAADTLYGAKMPMLSALKRKYKPGHGETEEKPMIGRVALHSYGIEFFDRQGKPLSIASPYAHDLEVFVKLLRRYDSVMPY